MLSDIRNHLREIQLTFTSQIICYVNPDDRKLLNVSSSPSTFNLAQFAAFVWLVFGNLDFMNHVNLQYTCRNRYERYERGVIATISLCNRMQVKIASNSPIGG